MISTTSSPIIHPVRPACFSHVKEDVDYRDGIHLDFMRGLYYVKAAGATPTIAALTSLFTFTGGNQSYYMGPAGLLVPSATNTPRFAYDANGNCLGLLMEAARTNLGLHSNDATNAAWAKTNITAAKTETGPDGVASSASSLTATAANATCLQSITSASAQRTFSVWLKRLTGTGNIDLTVDNGTTWTTKTITSSWAQCAITQSAVTNPVFGFRIVTNGDAVAFWCSQLESAAFASSPIPTTTASVARTADSCIRPLGSEFSATAGTVVVQGRASGGQDAALHQHVYGFDNNTNQEMFRLFRQATTNTCYLQIQDGGVEQTGMTATFTNSANFRHAVAWAANDATSYLDGALVATGAPDPSVTLPTVTQLGLGQAGFQSTTQMNGHIRKFDYWPTRLPNGFLVSYNPS